MAKAVISSESDGDNVEDDSDPLAESQSTEAEGFEAGNSDEDVTSTEVIDLTKSDDCDYDCEGKKTRQVYFLSIHVSPIRSR